MVLYTSADDPEMRSFAAPEGVCRSFDLETFDFRRRYAPAAVVVLTGHSTPPRYLNTTPERVASAVACFEPGLVVADTCYGFSSPLLAALAERRLTPLFVGPTEELPAEGLRYGPDFFRPVSAARRARAVQRQSADATLVRWKLDPPRLTAALADVATWSPDRLTDALERVHPNLVKVPIPRTGATVLVPVEPARFRRPDAAHLGP
ncbi:MAG: hypothetical protein ACRC33_11590 [Gemmataceae bacterium]